MYDYLQSAPTASMTDLKPSLSKHSASSAEETKFTTLDNKKEGKKRFQNIIQRFQNINIKNTANTANTTNTANAENFTGNMTISFSY